MKRPTDEHGARRYEMDRADAGTTGAIEAVKRLRQLLPPGLIDAVASMCISDLESAMARVAWIRERLEGQTAPGVNTGENFTQVSKGKTRDTVEGSR